MWRRRPPALAASKEPARLYTYHKLHAWDPTVVKGAPRVAFVDADAIYVRNASALLEIEQVERMLADGTADVDKADVLDQTPLLLLSRNRCMRVGD